MNIMLNNIGATIIPIITKEANNINTMIITKMANIELIHSNFLYLSDIKFINIPTPYIIKQPIGKLINKPKNI